MMGFTARDWARIFCDGQERSTGVRPSEDVVTKAVEQLAAELQSDPEEDTSNHARLILNLVTNNPAVVAVMGTSGEPCMLQACQFRRISHELATTYREGVSDGRKERSRIEQVSGVDKR